METEGDIVKTNIAHNPVRYYWGIYSYLGGVREKWLPFDWISIKSKFDIDNLQKNIMQNVFLYNPKLITPATVEFVDIAGLVRGASKGEGLGNQFLSHIRDVNAIIHVVRAFKEDNVAHVDENLNPLRDIETIETELLIRDMDSVEKRIDKLKKMHVLEIKI